MKKKTLIKKAANKGVAMGLAMAMAIAAAGSFNFRQTGLSEVYAEEGDTDISTMPLPLETPAYVRSVYTNEWVTPEQAA